MSLSNVSFQPRKLLTVNLDPTVAFAEQIRRGNYGCVNPNITAENFNLSIPTGKREIVLFDPRGYVSSSNMIAWMKADGFKPATIDDALAMGVQFPERQRRYCIVFLGSVWRDVDGHSVVPVIGGVFDSQVLDLRRFDKGWGGFLDLGLSWLIFRWLGYYRFAAVKW